MNKSKISTLLGFAAKSGNILLGQEGIIKALGNKNIVLVFCGSDTAQGSRDKIYKKCQHLDIPCCLEFTVAELSKAIGKDNRTAIAITDNNFGQSMLNYIRQK